MNEAQVARSAKKQGDIAPKTGGGERPFLPKPPLKPHPHLFYTLLAVLALWIGVLLWLFFTTVWPLRHSISATRPALP